MMALITGFGERAIGRIALTTFPITALTPYATFERICLASGGMKVPAGILLGLHQVVTLDFVARFHENFVDLHEIGQSASGLELIYHLDGGLRSSQNTASGAQNNGKKGGYETHPPNLTTI